MASKFALIIACSEYQDERLRILPKTEADAAGIRAVLTDPQLCGFPENHVELQINEPGYSTKVSIEKFFKNREREDLLVLYFAGHGIIDDHRRLTLALNETDPEYRATGIEARFLREEMENCRSDRQILILDCCNAGAFASARDAKGAPAGLEEALRGKGRFVLAASDKLQFSFDEVAGREAIKNGIFTHYLIDGLRDYKALSTNGRTITATSLYNYAHEEVARATEQRQTPVLILPDEKRVGEIVLAHKPEPVVPETLRALLEHANYTQRLAGVYQLRDAVRSGEDYADAARKALHEMADQPQHREVHQAIDKVLAEVAQGEEHGPEAIKAKAKPKTKEQAEDEGPGSLFPFTTYSAHLPGGYGDISASVSQKLPPEVEDEIKRKAENILQEQQRAMERLKTKEEPAKREAALEAKRKADEEKDEQSEEEAEEAARRKADEGEEEEEEEERKRRAVEQTKRKAAAQAERERQKDDEKHKAEGEPPLQSAEPDYPTHPVRSKPVQKKIIARGVAVIGAVFVVVIMLSVYQKSTVPPPEEPPEPSTSSSPPEIPNYKLWQLAEAEKVARDTTRFHEAEAMMRRALEINEASYGPNHPEVAIILNNLALLMQATSRFDEAEVLMRRVIVIFQTSYGPSHPNVAISLSNLATLLYATNRLNEAEPLYRRALEIDEANFGPEHPKVAADLHNLAILLQDTKRFDKAKVERLDLSASRSAEYPDIPSARDSSETNSIVELNSDQWREVQRALNDIGFDAGPIDGVPGWKTRNAISSFQESRSLPSTGELTESQREILLADAREASHGRLGAEREPGTVFRDKFKDGSEGPEMVVIPAGSFLMGSSPGEGEDNERPQHKVTIAKPFAMGKFEVTFDEYDRFAEAVGRKKPGDESWGRGNRPVINVNWDDAVAYAEWLSSETGKRYRLPTEAEWEYAARAGTDTEYWWGINIKQDGKIWANCDGCGSARDIKQTAPVGSFDPNPFGLHDTTGNVWEWTQDCWHSSYKNAPKDTREWGGEDGGECGQRVIRGGAWDIRPRYLRSENRGWLKTFYPANYLGFRLAQDL